jgi:hypothetical protein
MIPMEVISSLGDGIPGHNVFATGNYGGNWTCHQAPQAPS